MASDSTGTKYKDKHFVLQLIDSGNCGIYFYIVI